MEFKANPNSGGGSRNFLKLKDQEQVHIVVRGNPVEYYVRWDNGKSTIVEEGSPKAQFRFRINVVVQENGVMVSKIWEQGAAKYNELKELHDEYDLSLTMLKLKRSGVGMETEYSILPMRKELTKEQLAKLDAVQLQDLALPKKDAPASEMPAPFDQDEEISF